MSKEKTYFFSNFNCDLDNFSSTNDKLEINKLDNLEITNGIVESKIKASELLKNYFTNEDYISIFNNNETILKKTIQIIPYEFFNEENSNYIVDIFLITNEKILYKLNKTSKYFEQKHIFQNDPKIENFKNKILFYDSNGTCLKVEKNNNISIESLPKIRTFCNDENTLYFCYENQPYKFLINNICDIDSLSQNIQQYTFLETNREDGEILGIFFINNKIYILCQYSLLKYNKNDNCFVKEFLINNHININSIKKFNDRIIFCSNNTIFVFDGNNFKHYKTIYIFSKNANYVIFNNNYCILPNILCDFVLCFNLLSESFSIYKFHNITNIYTIKNANSYNFCMCYQDDNNYYNITLFNNTNTINFLKNLSFKNINFNSVLDKEITYIKINCEGSMNFNISSNKNNSSFNISGITEIISPNICGTNFNFNINSNTNFKLFSIIVSIKEIGE